MSSSGAIAFVAEDEALPLAAKVRDLVQQRRYVAAFHQAEAHGPCDGWTGTSERILAARVLRYVGAPRRSNLLIVRTWRADRTHAEAAYYYLHHVLSNLGPLAAWRLLQRLGPDLGHTPEERALWAIGHANVLGSLRDHEAAMRWLDTARRHEASSFAEVVHCSLLEAADRYDEALAATERSLELEPWNRAAVMAKAHCLELLGRSEEAREQLEEAQKTSEVSAYAFDLARLQLEQGDYAEAVASVDRFVELSPALELEGLSWAASLKSDALWALGERTASLEHMHAAGRFHTRIAERVARNPDGKRVLLDVPFVRQHSMTCVPATLSAISRRWSMPADHLQVAEEICYDGTPAASERRWAATNGWVPREFRLTWSDAVALLDRGMPFTLTTVEPGGAHLQAVVGYDAARGTLLVRDPFFAKVVEFDVEAMLERYSSTGPRGMVLVPLSEASRLEGLELTDASLYDLLHEVDTALLAHDRARACRAAGELEAAAPRSPVTFHARRAIVSYDEDEAGRLSLADDVLAVFPDDVNWRLVRLNALRALGRYEEYRQSLQTAATAENADPLFQAEYGAELVTDARAANEARFWVRRSMRASRNLGRGFNSLGNLEWNNGSRLRGLSFYRFSACLDDKLEGPNWAYFVASRFFDDSEEPGLTQAEVALRFLRERFAREGRRSSLPAFSVFNALEALDRLPEAFEVLEEALSKRPDDGELLLFAASTKSRYGRHDEAAAHLEAATGLVKPSRRSRVAARLMAERGEAEASLACWREVLEGEPLARDAHEAIALHLGSTVGAEAARKHLEDVASRHPNHAELQRLLLDHLRNADVEAAAAVVARILEHNPLDAWALREHAYLLGRLGRVDEARAALEEAKRVEPRTASWFNVRAWLHEREGELDEARACYREALDCDLDERWAFDGWYGLAADDERRREVLEYLEEGLATRRFFGGAVISYDSVIRALREPDDALARLTALRDRRPDLFETWVAVGRQLQAMSRLDDAAQTARTLCERFPLYVGSHLELASTERARGDAAGEMKALEAARKIAPHHPEIIRRLAALREEGADLDGAIDLLRQGAAALPLDASIRVSLSRLLWGREEKAEAIALVEHALRLRPEAEEAWRQLREWRVATGSRDDLLSFARSLAKLHSGLPWVWHALARTLDGSAEVDERLEAIERGLVLEPRLIDLHDLKAVSLAQAGRLDEARAACAPACFGDDVPVALRGRAAWLLAETGSLEQAREQMRALVGEVSDYGWGWARLAEWGASAGDWESVVEASSRAAEAFPGDPEFHGRLGQALAKLGRTQEALTAFGEATRLDPSYTFAAFQTCELAMAAGDLDGAAAALASASPYAPPTNVLALQVEVESRRDLPTAFARYESLLALPETDRWALSKATDALTAVAPERMAETLDVEVRRASAHPVIGFKWAGLVLARRSWLAVGRLLRELPAQVSPEAVGGLVEAVAKSPAGFLRLLLLTTFWRRWFTQSNQGWSATGYGWMALGRRNRAWRWLADWRARQGLERWQLLNVVCAAMGVGRFEEACDALDAMRQVPVEYEEDGQVEAFGAFTYALMGRPDDARTMLAAPAPVDSMPSLKPARGLAEILLLVGDGPPGKETLKQIGWLLREHVCESSVLVGRLRAVTRARVRRAIGGIRGWFWWLTNP